MQDYLKVLKLFPVACRFGWQGWKWIEIWKKLQFFQILLLRLQKILKNFNLLWLALSDKNSFDIFVVALQKHFVNE